MPFALPPLAHVGIVVADLERAAADYERRWGAPTENVTDMVLDDARLHGTPAATSARYGFISTGASQIELIQPLGGPSPYTEFLKTNGGDGVHHLAYIVDAIDPFIEHLRETGETGETVDVAFTTSCTFPGLGSGRFTYIDGVMHGPAVELIELTAVSSLPHHDTNRTRTMSTSTSTAVAPVVLEPVAQEFAEATADPPYLFDLGPVKGRKTVDEVQSSEIEKPDVDIEDTTIPGGPTGEVSVRILRPESTSDQLPVILYTHGAGWVFGNAHTHDRLIRELAAGTGAAVVFTNYSLSPEAHYPTAIEEIYAVLEWVAQPGPENDLDGSRIAVAGDSVGGNMTAAITLMDKQRSGPKLAAQVLFYPVTDASFDTDSYHQFAEGYFLRRDAMQWFWDQYTTDEHDRAEITASPLRASVEDLTGLPKALVITGEADVLRDEGEAYGRKLREAGVDVTATRYEGIIHDFVMLNALRGTNAAGAAIAQAVTYLRNALA